jgi:hypothetical protein
LLLDPERPPHVISAMTSTSTLGRRFVVGYVALPTSAFFL